MNLKLMESYPRNEIGTIIKFLHFLVLLLLHSLLLFQKDVKFFQKWVQRTFLCVSRLFFSVDREKNLQIILFLHCIIAGNETVTM